MSGSLNGVTIEPSIGKYKNGPPQYRYIFGLANCKYHVDGQQLTRPVAHRGEMRATSSFGSPAKYLQGRSDVLRRS